MKVDDHAWLARVRQAQPRELWRGLRLWFELHEAPEKQRLLGTNPQELIGFLQTYAKYLRAQIASGNLEEAVMFWLIMRYGGPWEYLGISPQEAREWVDARVRQLYTAIGTRPENAAHILTISGRNDTDCVRALGVQDSQRLAQLAITWAQQAYAYLQQPNIDAGQAIDKVGLLLMTFVISRYYFEVEHADPTRQCLSIYPHLGFSGEALAGLYAELLTQCA